MRSPRKGCASLRCGGRSPHSYRGRFFFFFTRHLLMFLQHARKCWTEQYVLMGLGFRFYVCSQMTSFNQQPLSVVRLCGFGVLCDGEGLFILLGGIVAFSKYPFGSTVYFQCLVPSDQDTVNTCGCWGRLRLSVSFLFCSSRLVSLGFVCWPLHGPAPWLQTLWQCMLHACGPHALTQTARSLCTRDAGTHRSWGCLLLPPAGTRQSHAALVSTTLGAGLCARDHGDSLTRSVDTSVSEEPTAPPHSSTLSHAVTRRHTPGPRVTRAQPLRTDRP